MKATESRSRNAATGGKKAEESDGTVSVHFLFTK
jgi:hypothetical protein